MFSTVLYLKYPYASASTACPYLASEFALTFILVCSVKLFCTFRCEAKLICIFCPKIKIQGGGLRCFVFVSAEIL